MDELLRGEFGLEDGLADTATWGKTAVGREAVEIPDGMSPDLRGDNQDENVATI